MLLQALNPDFWAIQAEDPILGFKQGMWSFPRLNGRREVLWR
jgi:hypothetical protein